MTLETNHVHEKPFYGDIFFKHALYLSDRHDDKAALDLQRVRQ